MSVAVPEAPAATLNVPVTPSALTPENVVVAAPPPRVEVSEEPLSRAKEILPDPLAPALGTRFAIRSVIVKPVGAVTVKAKVLPVVRPATALSGIEAMNPPLFVPEVIGVMLIWPESELERVLEMAL